MDLPKCFSAVLYTNTIRTLICIAVGLWAFPLLLPAQSTEQQELLDSVAQYPVVDTQYVSLLNDLAYTYWYSDPQKTDSLGQIAMQLSDQLEYPRGKCRSYRNMAIGQWMLGDYPLAFEHASEQLKIAEEYGLESQAISAYSMMALITEDQGLLEEALKYHQLVLNYRREQKDSLSMSSTLNNMGSVYWQMNKLDSSLQLFQEAYAIRLTKGSKRNQRESLSNIGYILNEQGKPEEAMPIIKKTLAMAIEMDDPNGIVNNREALGNIYLNLNQLDSAEMVYHEALEMAEEIGINKRVIVMTGHLAELYKKKNDYRKAYEYLNAYWVLKDSIEGQESANQLSRLQDQYESEKKELEIIRLQQENQVNLNLRNAFALGTIITLTFAFLLFRFYRYRQKKNLELIETKDQQTRQLEEVNHLKSRFLANLSHEFRTPLTLILGPAEQLLTSKPDGPEKMQINWIYNNSRKLLKLINQLLDLSKVEAGKLDLKASQQDLVQFCRYVMSAFESLANQKNIQLVLQPPPQQIFLYFDPEKLEQVLNNLLSNALKFTDEGRVLLRLETTEENGGGFARISIIDSGSGIHDQQLPHIFDRFYQASQDMPSALEGTGIGLALCKELIGLHSGRIEVESKLGVGTKFHIYLPLGRSHLKDEEITPGIAPPTGENPGTADVTIPVAEVAPEAADGQPLVLIVDDNPDMLEYIQMQLQHDFRFLKAQNGKEALLAAQKDTPDLIISDVMMPDINGYELCSMIKNDPTTDHIPVILLTARVGETYKIRGLEVEADDYIQKPFSQRELRVRIQNLVNSRKRLLQHFREVPLLETPKVTKNPKEAQFLQQLLDVVEAHLDDPQLDVNALCQHVGMSKSQLNRKTKAVLGKSPNQFIRSYRLEKAREMIKTTDYTLAEIAYDVGFSSPAYFSKCFHDEFGFPPSAL